VPLIAENPEVLKASRASPPLTAFSVTRLCEGVNYSANNFGLTNYQDGFK
jgi:hypothetical protein